MRKLIKDGEVIDNPWVIVDKESSLDDALALGKHLIVSVQLWLSSRDALLASGAEIGVWLDSDETPEAIANDLDRLTLIALNFPAFKDGRAFSSAAMLRRLYGYEGDLRAIGEVLRDPLSYMRSCGFTSFLLSEQVNVDDALAAFNDFKDHYQSNVIDPLPLFRRRA